MHTFRANMSALQTHECFLVQSFFKVLQLHQFDLECSPKPCRRTSTLEDQCFSASQNEGPWNSVLSYPTSPLLIGFGGGFPHVEMWLFFSRDHWFSPQVSTKQSPTKAFPRLQDGMSGSTSYPWAKKLETLYMAPSQWYLRWWNFTSSSLLSIVIYDLELPPTQDAIVTTRIMTF